MRQRYEGIHFVSSVEVISPILKLRTGVLGDDNGVHIASSKRTGCAVTLSQQKSMQNIISLYVLQRGLMEIEWYVIFFHGQ